MYVESRPLAEQILSDPDIKEKAKQLSLLQRTPKHDYKGEKEKDVQTTAEERQEDVTTSKLSERESFEQQIFQELPSLKPKQVTKSKVILAKILASDQVTINDKGKLMVNGYEINLPASTFLYDLQQPTKKLRDEHEAVISRVDIPSQMVANQKAKILIEQGSQREQAEKQTKPATKRKAEYRDVPEEEEEESETEEEESSYFWSRPFKK